MSRTAVVKIHTVRLFYHFFPVGRHSLELKVVSDDPSADRPPLPLVPVAPHRAPVEAPDSPPGPPPAAAAERPPARRDAERDAERGGGTITVRGFGCSCVRWQSRGGEEVFTDSPTVRVAWEPLQCCRAKCLLAVGRDAGLALLAAMMLHVMPRVIKGHSVVASYIIPAFILWLAILLMMRPWGLVIVPADSGDDEQGTFVPFVSRRHAVLTAREWAALGQPVTEDEDVERAAPVVPVADAESSSPPGAETRAAHGAAEAEEFETTVVGATHVVGDMGATDGGDFDGAARGETRLQLPVYMRRGVPVRRESCVKTPVDPWCVSAFLLGWAFLTLTVVNTGLTINFAVDCRESDGCFVPGYVR
eukprot:Selendium_serpulae@DN2610_c0_g1_i2.p1